MECQEHRNAHILAFHVHERRCKEMPDLLMLGGYEQVLGATTCLAVSGINNVLLHSVL